MTVKGRSAEPLEHESISRDDEGYGVALTPEETKRILDDRARDLAQGRNLETDAARLLGVVVFTLAKERYAIESRFVWEVTKMVEFAPVPDTPASVVGVVNLQGRVIVVNNLRPLLKVSAAIQSDLTRLIILGETEPEFGILADSVDGLADIDIDDIHAPPDYLSGLSFIKGMTDDAMLFLDGVALIDDPCFFA